MLIRLLFWFVVFYVSFKFIIRVVLPLVVATRSVSAKMKDMRESMDSAEPNAQTKNSPDSLKTKDPKSASKGEYIDFEEVK